MNKTLLLIITLTFCSTIVVGQNLDYKEVRKQLTTLSCGKVDSIDLYHTKIKLETFDTTKIGKNLDVYYRDLAWCYYRIFIRHYDTTYLKLDIINYLKSLYHKPNNTQALWGILFAYYKLGDCINGKKYLDLFLQYKDEKEDKKSQIESLTNNCN